jgi:AraC-like DNA-binding protein
MNDNPAVKIINFFSMAKPLLLFAQIAVIPIVHGDATHSPDLRQALIPGPTKCLTGAKNITNHIDIFGQNGGNLTKLNKMAGPFNAQQQQGTQMVKHSETHMADRTVRVGPMCQVESLLHILECEPREIIEAAGLSPEDLLDVNHHLPYVAATHLLDQCAKASGCDHFGLLLGQRFLVVQLGIAGQLACTAPDVATALHDIVSNFHLHDQGGITVLDSSSRYASFGYTIIDPRVVSVDQVHDLSTAAICGTMRSLCGGNWNPVKVELSRAEPKDTRPYAAYFRAPVLFSAPKNKLVFSKRWLDHSPGTADADDHMRLLRDARTLCSAEPRSFSWEVRIALHNRLAMGDINATSVAATLGLHERTLHRRLRIENTSFRKLLEQVRQTTSCYYLAGTALPIREIAISLGYHSTDAFDHAFRRWFGSSPLKWRKQNMALAFPVRIQTGPATAARTCQSVA